ncbi:MAG: hypothetical protein GX219_10420 [Tissierellia bacterium]|nr:hypothetical protein [Tissierellia bacterium]
MKKSIVLYKSKYGSAKKYAEWISEELNCKVLDMDKVDISSLHVFDNIICGQGIYAGNFSVGKDLANIIETYPQKNYIFYSVSLSDPNSEVDRDSILKSVESAIGSANLDKVKVFFFRGDYYFSKMTLVHKAMMWMMKNMLKRKPEEEKTDDDRALIENYNGSFEFADKSYIVDLINYVKGIGLV